MQVMSVSHMFPNRFAPNSGVFVKERIKHVARKIDIKMVAPLAYFPMQHIFKKYKNFNKLEKVEIFDTLQVCHPRYFSIPRYYNFFDGYFYYLSTRRFFEHEIRKNHIDLLDFHWVYPDAFAGLKLARKLGIKIVTTIRGNESICYFEKSLRKKMLINTLKQVDHIIAVSSDMKKKVVDDYGVNEDKVTVIPNGIDNCKFWRIDKQEAKKLCGLDPSRRYVLSLCRLSHEKGLEYLLKAYASLKYPDLTLIVVGDGPLRSKLENLSRALGIAGQVRFIGVVTHDETFKWFNAADLYCLPSLWEGCPNTIIESLACGTPVISTTVGGVPDLVPDESYGYLVSPADEKMLAQALRKAIDRDWSSADVARFGCHNTWDHVADRVIKVFQSVLG